MRLHPDRGVLQHGDHALKRRRTGSAGTNRQILAPAGDTSADTRRAPARPASALLGASENTIGVFPLAPSLPIANIAESSTRRSREVSLSAHSDASAFSVAKPTPPEETDRSRESSGRAARPPDLSFRASFSLARATPSLSEATSHVISSVPATKRCCS